VEMPDHKMSEQITTYVPVQIMGNLFLDTDITELGKINVILIAVTFTVGFE